MFLSDDEVYTISIPEAILSAKNGQIQQVEIKPLSVHTFQLIAKAAKDDHSLIPLLMVKEGLVSPTLTIGQIGKMKIGLVNFLIAEIKKASGIVESYS